MDQHEAIQLLKAGPEGVKKWNEWHKAGSRANLNGADLSGASLRGVDLFGAALGGADLSRADLRGGNLNLADLSSGNLRGADLRGANLAAANFRGAKMEGADLAEALCVDTSFAQVDLSHVLGLEKVRHLGPSIIGIDTLYLSGGRIPEAFLRDCGVPESLIRQIPSLIGSEPVQFYSCFISHSTKDEEFARHLHHRLRDNRLRVWHSPHGIQGGRKLVDQVDTAARQHDKLLLVLSEHSVKSGWVGTEIYRASQRGHQEGRKLLFPIRLCPFEAIREWKLFDADSGRDLAQEVREYCVPDFSNWKDHDAFERALARLLRDLRSD